MNNIGPHVSGVSSKRFARKSNLEKRTLTHTREKNSLACDVCNRQFSDKGNLNKHLFLHTGLKPHVCNVCNKQFARKGDLKKHVFLHTGVKLYECEVCNKQFASKGGYTFHLFQHTGIKFVCEFCNKQFFHKNLYKQHLVVHTEEKPYTCEVCNKQFTRNADLKKHLIIHTNREKYTCEFCGKQFMRKHSLKDHFEAFHASEQPCMTCEFCHKQFTRRRSFKRHLLLHTQKPHECEVCNKQFIRKYRLNLHLSKQTDEQHIFYQIHCQQFPKSKSPEKNLPVHTEERTQKGPFIHYINPPVFSKEKEVYVHDSTECPNMGEKVQKFLQKVDDFKQGLTLTDDEINSAISFSDRDINVLTKTLHYKEFLKEYGSIYGSELYMGGPIAESYPGYKVDNIVGKNNTFTDYCIDYGITDEELKYYWLIGEYKNNFYYIDSSDNGKGYIYRMNLYSGKTKLFSEDFLGFLDKLFNICQKDKSDESENEDSY